MSGRYVAAASASCSPVGECYGSLRVVDLRSGRTIARTGGLVSNVLLKPNGSFSYAAAGGLHMRERGSTGPTLLDPGPGIDAASLATDGRHLYWLRDGQPQGAPFD